MGTDAQPLDPKDRIGTIALNVSLIILDTLLQAQNLPTQW
jgi:hypothetical protein